MRKIAIAVTVLAGAGFVVLLWKLPLANVGTLIASSGWALGVVLAQEIVAHLLNALGWKLAFDPRHARSVPLARLLQLRVAGDALNYVTPTATLGGEVGRAAMVKTSHGTAVDASSVIVAKLAQTLGQALFVATGVLLVAARYVSPVALSRAALALGGVGVVALGLLLALRTFRRPASFLARATPIRHAIGDFLRRHPLRFGASMALFATAYTWGVFEAFWICRCLGLRLPLATLLAIETMSAAIDGVFFMVPAKIGTQEGGKTAIFAALGLPLTTGFAFGLLRHLRELVWTCIGLTLCAWWWRDSLRRALRVRGFGRRRTEAAAGQHAEQPTR